MQIYKDSIHVKFFFILKAFSSHACILKITKNFPNNYFEYILIKGIIFGNFIGSTIATNYMISRKYYTYILIIWLLTLLSPYCCEVFLVEEELSSSSFLVTLEYLKKDFLKVGLSPSKKNFFIRFNNSPSRMMKNAFYFILKALFFLKIFKVLSWLFGHVEKMAWLER